MTRYFLNVTNAHGPLIDDEGISARDLAHAREQAVANLLGVLSHELLSGTLDLRGKLEITDAEQQILETITFSQAVQVICP